MMARTHIAFASLMMVACSVGILQRMPQLHEVALAGAAGLLPDLDHPKSTFGRIVPYISIPLAAILGHRGFTHSLLMVASMVYLLLTYHQQHNWPVLPLVVGYLSHLIGDMLTPSGVPLLWPVRQKFSLNLFKSDGWMEHSIYRACWLGVGYFVWVALERPGNQWIAPLRLDLQTQLVDLLSHSKTMLVQLVIRLAST
ncbi:metal-dependent hydrolase [Chitinibacter fontanus]|uniref:Metal-dependent hydrolase n=1 Tax=Chitinibacter fontanus TaxID=1737446 RepID=A0A7D5V7X4_9NEIS|nr:metal-dependent hydrolase [Chitinibacter fontanus]QLI80152.1 metal-dependent hydrolase [Chitinibacter fontanus]